MRKHGGYIVKLALSAVMLCIVALSVSAATYAWFSSNSVVRTDRVSGKSNTDTVELLVSGTGGADFKGRKETAIVKIGSSDLNELMPVSTADLKHFVYNDGIVEDMAVHFSKTEEDYYYHGRVYLKAEAVNHDSGEVLALYLDGADERGEFFRNATGNVLNCVRLGLTFDGGTPFIFRVGEEQNPDREKAADTYLYGTKLADNQVIDSSGEVLRAVYDPSVPLKQYMLGQNGTTENVVKPMLLMELNKIYTVDIYVYLEGCDPDCTEMVQQSSLDFYLAFYGILTRRDG